ncbi:MAG TPA: hypothetical protein PKX90_12730, partial [bacterium]|nr:hypothetical protein [bacterium]
IALGRFSPIYFIIKNIFIFKKFRAISRFVLLVNFYQIIISGYGLLFFLQSYKKRKIKFSVFNLFISLFLFLFLLFGLVVYFQKEYILQKSFIYLKEFSEGKAPEFLKAIEKGIRTYPIEYYYGKLKRYLNTVSKHLILQMCLIIIFFKMFYVFYKKNIKIFYLLILIFIIYFLDAYFFSKNFFVFINKNFYSEKPKTLDKLLDIVNIDKTKSMYYRFFSLNRGIMHLPFKYYFGFANDLLVFEHLKNFIYRNTGLNYKLNLFYGEDTLEFRRLYQMKSLIKIGWFNLLKFSSTKYIFTDSLLPESHFEFKNCENNVYFYTFKNPLPHFYFANNYLVIKDENEILKKLNDESINFENTIIIEEEEEFKFGGEIKGKIENLKYSDNEKVFFVKLDKPAFFILTDSFFPAWNCFVNNKKTKIYLTNYLFQSVYLPAGEHKIEFIYNDEFFKIGKYISFVSIVIIIFILIKREEKL